MSIKICHVTSSHQRYDGRILEKECLSLSKKYDTYLLCADIKENEKINEVNIVSINFKPKNRYERFFKVMSKLYKKSIELDCDIYHLHDPELLNIALKLKNKGKKVIFDSHEDYPSCISERKWIPKRFRKMVSQLYSIKEKRVLKKIDAVITVTPAVLNRISKYNKNVVMVTNYPIIEKEIKRKSVKNTMCFAGGISSQWMHHNILKAIDKIDIKYIIAGNNENTYFDSLKQIKGYKKVEAIGKISKKEVKELYSTSTIGIALNDYVANVGFHEGSLGNTKIFEYMEAGLPIVATDFNLWYDIIEKNKCGICVNPNNINQITNAIKYMLDNPKKAIEMGKNGRRLVEEKYNWNTQEKILFDLYRNLTEGEK